MHHKAKMSVIDICGAIDGQRDFYPESCKLFFAAFVPSLLPIFWPMVVDAFASKYPKSNIIGNPNIPNGQFHRILVLFINFGLLSN
jgi:hypothetical protein